MEALKCIYLLFMEIIYLLYYRRIIIEASTTEETTTEETTVHTTTTSKATTTTTGISDRNRISKRVKVFINFKRKIFRKTSPLHVDYLNILNWNTKNRSSMSYQRVNAYKI